MVVDAGEVADQPGDPGRATEDSSSSVRQPEEAEEIHEAIGVWVTRWDFKNAQEIETIMAQAASAGFNQVYFQVRGAADAYYKSSYEPWAAPLSGKLGKNPGWDPLKVAVEAAHQNKLELHAWINVATAWKGKTPPGRSKPMHLMRTHPEWRVAKKNRRPMPYNDGYIFFNPILPGFVTHLEGVVAELASFYAIDGLHLDYCRYPSAEVSYDKQARRMYKKARQKEKNLTRADWQRRELARVVGRLSKKIREANPRVQVSAAVTGIYQDRWNWGSVTQGYHDFFQDSHLWAQNKAVDALIPMIYWPPTKPQGRRTDFATLAQDFTSLGGHVTLLAGINVEAGDLSVLRNEVTIARWNGYHGVVLFSWELLKQRGWLGRLKSEVFGLAVPKEQVSIR